MGWKERSKCRQLLKCTSVFSLRPRSAKGVRRELAGNLCSWGSQGLRGKPATPVHPQPGIRAAPGTRHLRGAGAGTGLGRTPGLWGAGDHHSRSLTLSLLSYPGQWKPHRSSPFPTPGGCSLGYLWSPVSPRRCSSTGLGRCHLLGCLWGVSPNTAAVPRACDTAQKCLFQHGREAFSLPWMRGSFPGLRVSLGPGYLPAQAKGRAGSWPRDRRCSNAYPAPFIPYLFRDLRARCCCSALCFHTIISLGSARGLRAGLSSEKRHRPAQGRADVPLPRTQGPASCHPHTEQGQHTKGPSWKALSQETGPTCEAEK